MSFSSRNSSAVPGFEDLDARERPALPRNKSVEEPIRPAFGKAARRAPKEIVIEFFCTGLLETDNLAAFLD